MRKSWLADLPGALVGLGLMALAATAPIQIVLAQETDGLPGWAVAAAGVAPVLATAGALAAAYFSFQQARQAGIARRAEHVMPSLLLVLDAADDLLEVLIVLDGEFDFCDLNAGEWTRDPERIVLETMSKFDGAVDALFRVQARLRAIGEPELWRLGIAAHLSCVAAESRYREKWVRRNMLSGDLEACRAASVSFSLQLPNESPSPLVRDLHTEVLARIEALTASWG